MQGIGEEDCSAGEWGGALQFRGVGKGTVVQGSGKGYCSAGEWGGNCIVGERGGVL